MTKKIALTMIMLTLTMISGVAHLSFHASPLLCSLSTPSTQLESMSIQDNNVNIRAKVVDLESKILKEWSATNYNDLTSENITSDSNKNKNQDSSSNIPSIVNSVSRSNFSTSLDEETKTNIEEFKKMGFATEDIIIALKKSNDSHDLAAEMLEVMEEGKDLLIQKIQEIGNHIVF